MDASFIKIGNIEIMWYSILLLVAITVGILLIIKEGSKFKYDKDFLFNLSFWCIIFGFLGARIYFVLFNIHLYENNILNIFKIWEGGLAIHGGIIAGLITAFIYCKKYKVNIIKILDITVPALIIGQAIGRWGNFFNKEAYGSVTSLENLQNYNIPEFIIEGMYINGNYYHPTFFYESLWCIIGFIILILARKFKYIKTGQLTALYLIWYGVGRFFIESLRTDSLMFGAFKIAQIVSIAMIIMGIIITLVINRKTKFEGLYNSEENIVKF